MHISLQVSFTSKHKDVLSLSTSLISNRSDTHYNSFSSQPPFKNIHTKLNIPILFEDYLLVLELQLRHTNPYHKIFGNQRSKISMQKIAVPSLEEKINLQLCPISYKEWNLTYLVQPYVSIFPQPKSKMYALIKSIANMKHLVTEGKRL